MSVSVTQLRKTFLGSWATRATRTLLVCARSTQLSIMESLIAYDSDKSYVQEDVEAPFTLTLPYVPFHTGSSSSSSGDDNSVELLSDLQTTSDEK